MQSKPVSGSAVAAFRLNSLPQDAFVHPAWARAQRQALEALSRRERVLLLGLPGTGKTLLLRHLEKTLRGRDLSVRLLRNGDPMDDLFERDVLLIDEAGLMTAAEVERLMESPNPLIAVGLPSLSERLPFCLAAFRRVTLEPLSPEDVARFVLARLGQSGRPRGMFTPEALVALAHQSGGLLRLVIILAGAALFFAEQRGAAEVTAADVTEAALMRAVASVEAEPETTLAQEFLDTKTASKDVLGEALDIEPAWPGPAETGARSWARPLAIAGATGWVCTSLAVIAVATIAARRISSLPPMALQDVQGRSAPQLASAAAPDLAHSPETERASLLPVQTVTAMLPTIVTAAAPPASRPVSSLETGRSEIDVAPPAPAPLASGSALLDVAAASTVLAFAGPILNDTMGRGGELTLQLQAGRAHGPVAAVFHASKGLIGSGVLNGEMGPDGRITLSGRLMMGRNPFDCTIQATLRGERLVGAAIFVRATSGAVAHSSFNLTRL